MSRTFFQEAEERLDRSIEWFMNAVVRATGYPKEKIQELWLHALEPEKEPETQPSTPPPSPALVPVKAPEKPSVPAPVQAPAPAPVSDAKPRCVHLMTRGKNEGKECGNPSKSGTSYCAKHQPAKVVLEEEEEKPVKEEKKPEKVEKQEEEKPVKEEKKPEKVEKQEEEKPVKEEKKPEKEEKSKKVVPEKQLRVKEYDESFEAATVMTVTEAKRLDARIKDREFNLQNKSYPPAEIVAKGAHRVIAGTDVVVNESGSEILGYLEGETFVRSPNRSTDRATVDYGLPFNSDGVEIDE
jgi:hypothetical protein